jgi:hypothetical protein
MLLSRRKLLRERLSLEDDWWSNCSKAAERDVELKSARHGFIYSWLLEKLKCRGNLPIEIRFFLPRKKRKKLQTSGHYQFCKRYTCIVLLTHFIYLFKMHRVPAYTKRAGFTL